MTASGDESGSSCGLGYVMGGASRSASDAHGCRGAWDCEIVDADCVISFEDCVTGAEEGWVNVAEEGWVNVAEGWENGDAVGLDCDAVDSGSVAEGLGFAYAGSGYVAVDLDFAYAGSGFGGADLGYGGVGWESLVD